MFEVKILINKENKNYISVLFSLLFLMQTLTAAQADPLLIHYAPDTDLMDEDWDVDVDREGTNDLLLDDWIDQLSSIAEEIGLPLDTNTITSCVSDGTVGLQHSESLL